MKKLTKRCRSCSCGRLESLNFKPRFCFHGTHDLLSFIGFTGTPIEIGDKNTQAFSDYITVYDPAIEEDKATVPICYEARPAKIDSRVGGTPEDPDFEEVTEDAEETTKESLPRKWAQLEAMVGTDKRIALVAEALVKHWEARYAREAMVVS